MCLCATLAYNVDNGSMSSCTFVACLFRIVSAAVYSSAVTWIVSNPCIYVSAFPHAIIGTVESHADCGITSFSKASRAE